MKKTKMTLEMLEKIDSLRKKKLTNAEISHIMERDLSTVSKYTTALGALETGRMINPKSVGATLMIQYAAKHGYPTPIIVGKAVYVQEENGTEENEEDTQAEILSDLNYAIDKMADAVKHWFKYMITH